MISLKRNSKLQLVPALGKRSRQSSIYKPNQTEPFKISRGKFSDFLKQNGIKEIESLNTAFDVDLHEAVAKLKVEKCMPELHVGQRHPP